MDDPHLTHFIVVYTLKQKPAQFPIQHLHTILPFMIQQRGITSIRKLIFSFKVTDWTQYPYGLHYLVLERSIKREGTFHVHFQHYMDQFNHLVMIPHEQQMIDFYTVLRLIYEHDVLAEQVGRGIIDPFFKTNDSGLLC